MACLSVAVSSAILAMAPLRSMALQVQSHLDVASSVETKGYGDGQCPCVGIAVSGLTTVKINGSSEVGLYPASIGSSCRPWDEGLYPGSCDGDNSASWCSDSWCYVDPCNCNIGTNPTESGYLKGATYEGKQIFYSYATCGGSNTYKTPPSDEQTQACSAQWDAAKFGLSDCPCVGIDGVTGNTDVVIGGKIFPGKYPADIGSGCAAWDEGLYPGSCNSSSPALWCSQKWCYVDKDNCVLPQGQKGPFSTDYLPGAKFQGKGLYYSYVTCGATNSYD